MINHTINCTPDEAFVMASIDKGILDYIPTYDKYTSEMEEILLQEYGEGFLDKSKLERYENIPSYISDEDIALWEAELLLYEENYMASYPESKVLKKSA